jgi:GxxExxY protein
VLEQEALTERIIGAAIEVHRRLGPGFLESVYEVALCIELRKHGLAFARQLGVPILYDREEIALHRLDLVVDDEIVVELKAIKAVEDVHFAIVRSYLKALGRRHGLILNCAATRLGIHRVNGKRGVTADTALRLGKYFGVSPEVWLGLQADYDLRIAKRTTWPGIEPRVRTRDAA